MNPIWWLSLSGAAQIVVASLLGFLMLIPMQPWGKNVRLPVDRKGLLAAHLDWIMLAFMEFGAAFILQQFSLPHGRWIAGLLIFGGWINPLPYLFRGMGIDAFALTGPVRQKLAASLSGISSTAILAAWVVVIVSMVAEGLA